VLGRSGECPNRNPQEGGGPFLRKSKREMWRGAFAVWEEERKSCWLISSRPGPHLRAARVDSLRHTCRQSARCADGPVPRRGWSVICTRTSSTTPIALELCGRSAPHRRTVRQVQTDSPAHWADSPTCPFFYFSLIYSEIKI
jgi:hypothetical protein